MAHFPRALTIYERVKHEKYKRAEIATDNLCNLLVEIAYALLILY